MGILCDVFFFVEMHVDYCQMEGTLPAVIHMHLYKEKHIAQNTH